MHFYCEDFNLHFYSNLKCVSVVKSLTMHYHYTYNCRILSIMPVLIPDELAEK